MAETIAVIGLVGSIIQLVEFADLVLTRVNDFRNSTKEIPAAFRDISITLPLLVSNIKKTSVAAEAGEIPEEEKATLLAVVGGCSDQVKVGSEQ
jgi:hypothetical protein